VSEIRTPRHQPWWISVHAPRKATAATSVAARRHTATELCPYNFFAIRWWYEQHDGPTFPLLDATNRVIAGAPALVADATASYRFGPLTVYLFDYDIARHMLQGLLDGDAKLV